jgi:hypothetical protein
MTGAVCTAKGRVAPCDCPVFDEWGFEGTSLVWAAGGRSPSMMTKDNAVLVARSNLAKDMGSIPSGCVSVEEDAVREFRNHLDPEAQRRTNAQSPFGAVPEISGARHSVATLAFDSGS